MARAPVRTLNLRPDPLITHAEERPAPAIIGPAQCPVARKEENTKGPLFAAALKKMWLSTSTDRSIAATRVRFSIDGGSPLSVTQVAKALKLGRERVRRIEVEALNKREKVLSQSNL